jgi:hypothetical protein
MKNILIATLLVLSSCSFKKGQEQVHTLSPGETLVKTIKESSIDESLVAIEKSDPTSFKDFEFHADLYYAALKRGDQRIVEALIEKGYTPYSSNREVFSMRKEYDSLAFATLNEMSRKVTAEIETALRNSDQKKIDEIRASKGMSCGSVLTLHQQSLLYEVAYDASVTATMNPNSDSFIGINYRQNILINYFSKDSGCLESLKASPSKTMWLTNEILRGVYQKQGLKYTQMFKFLIPLFGNSRFSFQYNGNEMIGIEYFIAHRINNLQVDDSEKVFLADSWLKPLAELSRTRTISTILSDADIKRIEDTYLLTSNIYTKSPNYLEQRTTPFGQP